MCSLTSRTVPDLGQGSGSARSPEVVDEELLEAIKEQPNIPLAYLNSVGGEGDSAAIFRSRSCAKMPKLWDLHFNNLYWQKVKTSNGTFYLYGAYLDRRGNLRERLRCYNTSSSRYFN